CLKYSIATAATALSGPSQLLASSSANNNKFVLLIAAGSWDGWAAGLLMAKDAVAGAPGSVDQAVWPRGVFVRNQQADSVNPLLNAAFKSGDLVFNNYSKILEPVSQHACFGVGNSRSA